LSVYFGDKNCGETEEIVMALIVLSVFNAQSLTSAFLNFTAKATGKM